MTDFGANGYKVKPHIPSCYPSNSLASYTYFYRMIKMDEYRLGNYLMHKTGVRILTMRCTHQHFQLMATDGGKDLFPVVLAPTALEKSGFIENKKYALLPESREFILVLPVMGSGAIEIKAYLKSNKECFARAMISGVPITNNIYALHSLQNLYFALTGIELEVSL